jgi:hypothetical protein
MSVAESINRASALEELQRKCTAASSLSADQVCRAIISDLDLDGQLHEVLLTKLVRQALSDQDLRALLHQLQAQMNGLIDTDSNGFLRYSKAQVILANELRRKTSGLALVLRT